MSSLQSKEIIKNKMKDKKNNMWILLKVSHGIHILMLTHTYAKASTLFVGSTKTPDQYTEY